MNQASQSPLPITDRLAHFAASLDYEAIPPIVRHEARRSLLNYFGVALAACNDPTIQIATRTLQRFSAGTDAGLIGRSTKTDMLNAAALNAMAANVYDFDDTHLPTIIHPTSPIAPALFAFAQGNTISGRQLLTAFVAGVELTCRIGCAISPRHYARGWHITSTCGVLGAAAGVSNLLGLDGRHTGWALSHAAVQAGGLVETLGTMSKSVSVGNAARNGLLSALLAEEGFDGPAQPLEGERGFLRVMDDAPDLQGLVRDLGSHWETLNNTYKPYPCGVVLNPVIEACLVLQGEARLSDSGWKRITRITLTGHPLLRQRADRPGVRTGRESQVSAQHAVAVALVRGRAGLPEFSDEAVQDPVLQALGQRVSFKDDPSMAVHGVLLDLELDDGTIMTHCVDVARGALARPLTDADIEAKVRELCKQGGSGIDPEPLIDAVWHLDDLADASVPMRLAC